MKRWLNFRQIKDAVGIGVVLEYYEWKYMRRRGHQVQGHCPLRQGQRVDTFHADLRHNGFHCFCCQAHGSVLDLVARLERCSLLTEWFGVERWTSRSEWGDCRDTTPERIRRKERLAAPLRFTLRPVDSGHAYLHERGIEADTAAYFGAGYYAGPGLLHGRVVIHIHNERGQLLAYAGRSIRWRRPEIQVAHGLWKIQRTVQPPSSHGSQAEHSHRGRGILRLSEGAPSWPGLCRRPHGMLSINPAGGPAAGALWQGRADARWRSCRTARLPLHHQSHRRTMRRRDRQPGSRPTAISANNTIDSSNPV